MARLSRTLVVTGIAIVVAAAGMLAQAPQATGSISGTMFDAVTGAPIVDAKVLVQVLDEHHLTIGLTTDASGRFSGHGLAAADYLVRGEAPGYLVSMGGQQHPERRSMGGFQTYGLKVGEQIGGVRVPMWKPARLNGRVTNAEGKAVAKARVQLLAVVRVGDSLAYDFGTNLTSDDDGRYYAENLTPGEYVVAVMAIKSGAAFSRPTTFFPRATSLATAAPIAVSSGSVRDHVDIQLPALSGVRITGMVTGRESQARSFDESDYLNGTVRLIPADSPETRQGLETAAFETRGQSGRGDAFTLEHVPPGRYILRVADVPNGPNAGRLHFFGFEYAKSPLVLPRGELLWAEMPLTVTDKDLAGVVVALQPGIRIKGRIEADATGIALNDRPRFCPAIAGLHGPDGMPFGASNADGEFETVGTPPGRVTLTALPDVFGNLSHWSVQSVTVNGRNALGRGIDIGATSQPTALLTMTNQAARLTGRVIDGTDQSRPEASLLFFPTDRSAREAPFAISFSHMMGEARPRHDGTYRLAVPPGDYFIVAVNDVPDNWMRSDLLASLERIATRVTIAAHEQKTLDLRVK